VEQFAGSLRDYGSRITDLPTVLKEFAGRKLSLADWLMGQALSLRLHYILAPAWAFQRRLLEKLA
jgi:hypothetical protein